MVIIQKIHINIYNYIFKNIFIQQPNYIIIDFFKKIIFTFLLCAISLIGLIFSVAAIGLSLSLDFFDRVINVTILRRPQRTAQQTFLFATLYLLIASYHYTNNTRNNQHHQRDVIEILYTNIYFASAHLWQYFYPNQCRMIARRIFTECQEEYNAQQQRRERADSIGEVFEQEDQNRLPQQTFEQLNIREQLAQMRNRANDQGFENIIHNNRAIFLSNNPDYSRIPDDLFYHSDHFAALSDTAASIFKLSQDYLLNKRTSAIFRPGDWDNDWNGVLLRQNILLYYHLKELFRRYNFLGMEAGSRIKRLQIKYAILSWKRTKAGFAQFLDTFANSNTNQEARSFHMNIIGLLAQRYHHEQSIEIPIYAVIKKLCDTQPRVQLFVQKYHQQFSDNRLQIGQPSMLMSLMDVMMTRRYWDFNINPMGPLLDIFVYKDIFGQHPQQHRIEYFEYYYRQNALFMATSIISGLQKKPVFYIAGSGMLLLSEGMYMHFYFLQESVRLPLTLFIKENRSTKILLLTMLGVLYGLKVLRPDFFKEIQSQFQRSVQSMLSLKDVDHNKDLYKISIIIAICLINRIIGADNFYNNRTILQMFSLYYLAFFVNQIKAENLFSDLVIDNRMLSNLASLSAAFGSLGASSVILSKMVANTMADISRPELYKGLLNGLALLSIHLYLMDKNSKISGFNLVQMAILWVTYLYPFTKMMNNIDKCAATIKEAKILAQPHIEYRYRNDVVLPSSFPLLSFAHHQIKSNARRPSLR